jgi:hypothetical protein
MDGEILGHLEFCTQFRWYLDDHRKEMGTDVLEFNKGPK